MIFTSENNKLIIRHLTERICIEPWGQNSLRVRATQYTKFTGRDWALSEPLPQDVKKAEITIDGNQSAIIQNGRISARVNGSGVITFYKDDKQFLREYYRNYNGTESLESRCLKIIGRD